MLINLFSLVISILMLLSSLFVVLSTNPVYSILNLVLVFVLNVILLFNYQFYFLSLILLIVYVGAIAVLFLFVVMILNVGNIVYAEYFNNIFPLIFVSLSFFVGELLIIFFEEFFVDSSLKNSFLSCWHNSLTKSFLDKDLSNLSYLLYNTYGVYTMVSSFIMLLSMIGAIAITLNKIVIVKRQNLYLQLAKDVYTSIYTKNT